jgi:hypothetical protein
MPSLPDVMAEAASALPPEQVVMLSGAGDSWDGPASLPTGWELTDRVFSAFFLPGTLNTVLRHHSDVGWWLQDPFADPKKPRNPRPPRLETVLGVVAAVHGDGAVATALADIGAASPNRLHTFFAGHLAEGGRHLTANFDGCIEAAADKQYPGWRARGRLLHFHGSLLDDPSGKTLGATLSRIQGGFTGSLAAEFRDLFPASGILIVTGYSGSDFFDVDTAVSAMGPDSLAGLHVIWVMHNRLPWSRLGLPDEPKGDETKPLEVPPLIVHLHRAGADVEIICGPTSEFISALAARWKLPALAPPDPRTLWNPALTADPDKRRDATFMLYRELGLHSEIEEMFQNRPPFGIDPQVVWLARSELLWEQGRYGTLRRAWQSKAVPPGFSAAVRDERVGACLWVQGRLVPAYLWLTWHRRRCRDEADRLTLAETEGRVIEHMARTELRWLARRLAPGLIRALGNTGQQAGVHLYRRRNDLAGSLLAITGHPRPPTAARSSNEWFTEAGNLTSALNYRHRHYRDIYSGKTVGDTGLASRYHELQEQFISVGAPADAMAAHRLPRAERVFTTREVACGLRTVQYGWWHRFRLLSRFAVRRMQDRTRNLLRAHPENAADRMTVRR